MGTRNLTMVIQNEKPVVAQYGQWDGYPKGQGYTVLEFLRKVDLEKFKDKLKNVRFCNKKDEAAIKRFMKKIGCPDGWMTSEQAALYHKEYPYMTRDHGAKILDLIMKSEGEVLLQDSSDFAGDSLFCEWAYVIDLDKNVLECYGGFNKKPLNEDERFKDAQTTDSGYLPITCIKKYPLDKLPTKRQFVKDLESEEEEE